MTPERALLTRLVEWLDGTEGKVAWTGEQTLRDFVLPVTGIAEDARALLAEPEGGTPESNMLWEARNWAGRKPTRRSRADAEPEGDVNMKAIRFDLDRAGIEQRERESVELVELRAKVAELNRYIVRTPRSRAEAEAMVDAALRAAVHWEDGDIEDDVFDAHRAALLAALTGEEK